MYTALSRDVLGFTSPPTSRFPLNSGDISWASENILVVGGVKPNASFLHNCQFRWGDCKIGSLSTCEVEPLEVVDIVLIDLHIHVQIFNSTSICSDTFHYLTIYFPLALHWLILSLSFMLTYEYIQVPTCTTATPLPVSLSDIF